ncbi:MAG: hypothetical protein HY911_14695 [Desulfobacterales bacterium]|nr:hypothetical protein [Desulfobacterales bacterium]
MKTLPTSLSSKANRYLVAFCLLLGFGPTLHPAHAALNPITSCNVQGDNSAVNFKLKPSGEDLDLNSGGPAADLAAVLVHVGPGEKPTVRISCYGEGGNQPNSKVWLSPRFTVPGATYVGNPDKDKWRGSSWVLPVKPEWNEFAVKVDLVDSQGTLASSSSRTLRFFAFVLEMSPAGRLISPFSDYPEVRVQAAVTDVDGNVYAAIDCHDGKSQGRKVKRALVRFARDGSNLRLYEVKDDNASPMAVDNAGRLYAYCMNHIVEFNADMDFVRPIAAFTANIEHELTAEVLKGGAWPAKGKKRTVPFYSDFYPDRFASGCALRGNDLYYRACVYPSVAGGQNVFLAATSLTDGESKKLAAVKIGLGPLLGPGNTLYIVEDLKDSERRRNSRGYLTHEMKVFGLDGTLQKSIPFGETWSHSAVKGFDGAGYLLGRHWISSPDLQRFESLTYGRIRTRYLTPGASNKERIDVPFLKPADTHQVLDAGAWYHGGAMYINYADGAIVKCVSRVPGAEKDPLRGAGSGKLMAVGAASATGEAPATSAEQPDENGAAEAAGATGPVTPGQAAGATAAAGVLAILGSLLFSRAMGVDLAGIKEAVDLLLGPSSPAAAVAPPPPAPALHSDGEVNAHGEVWSENSGWVSRADYEKDVATRRLIDEVNTGVNARSDAVAQDLGRIAEDSRRRLEAMREAQHYVDLSTQLAERFGSTAEKAWCLDFINRHAKAGPNGYEIDPETARRMYDGLKKQMVTSGQIAHQAEAEYQTAAADELEKKGEVAAQIRDNATRVNRVLAKFDPTGTGEKIVGFQQGAYGAIDGYEKGGIAGAAEAAALTVADNYTEGYASGNYHALKEAYAEQGLSDQSLAERLAKANLETANNKYNALDHAGKAAHHLMEGEYGAAVDSTLDAVDAKDQLKQDYGKAREWATRPPAEAAPVATPEDGKKSLGTLRRESFEETRKSMDNEIKMMQELNRIADISDPVQRQAELVRVRNADPSTFNVAQKQMHPDTAAAVTDTNRALSDRVVERQAQILKEMGYDPGVRLTGKAGGADTDGFWSLKDADGKVLSDADTRKLAGDALEKASDEVLGPLGTDADQMGHKIMNDSPEKFSADPNDLGINSRDGRIEEGRLVFDDHAKTGAHWKDDPRQAALTAPKERISEAAMTRENAESLGEVMKTKTGHLDEIAQSRGAVSESDMRDLARELTKTNHRTFLPMAEKAGVKPTAEYRDLMQKLMLVKDGEISSGQLPPRSEIDRIIAENVGMLKQAL